MSAEPGLSRPLALHAGNLEPGVTEIDLYSFFSEISVSVSALRIIRDEATKGARYAYINFLSPEDAEKALHTLNYKQFKGQEILLSRSIPAAQRNPAANLYVSSLPENTPTEALAAALAPFGTIISARIAFAQDGTRHTYGYVQFESPEVANAVVEAVNAGPLTIAGTPQTIKAEIFKPSSERPRALATNIFVRNFPISSGKAAFETTVKQYGNVTSVFFQDACQNLQKSAPSETGFGFANFATHEEAQAALVELNKLTIGTFKLEAFPAKSKADRQREVHERSRSFTTSKANIYVKHIPQTQTAEELEAFFKSIGEVVSFKLHTNEVGSRTGVAYVQYRLPEDAQRAIQQTIQRQWYATIHQPRQQRQSYFRRSAARSMYRPRHQGGRRQFPQQGGEYGMYQYPRQNYGMRQMNGAPMMYQNGPRPDGRYQNGPRRRFNNNGQNGQPRQRRNQNQAPQQQANNAAAQSDQRQKLGEELFWKVQAIDAEQTPKITGMLLDMLPAEVAEILKNPDLLKEKVKEAQEILKNPTQQ